MEISLLIVLDLREQAALQAALMTHGAPDALVTLALTGACRIQSLDEARQLRRWLAETRASGKTDVASLNVIERELVRVGVYGYGEHSTRLRARDCPFRVRGRALRGARS